jgi:hypothetical protein
MPRKAPNKEVLVDFDGASRNQITEQLKTWILGDKKLIEDFPHLKKEIDVEDSNRVINSAGGFYDARISFSIETPYWKEDKIIVKTKIIDAYNPSLRSSYGDRCKQRITRLNRKVTVGELKWFIKKLRHFLTLQAEYDLHYSMREEERKKGRAIEKERNEYRDGLNKVLRGASIPLQVSYNLKEITIPVGKNREMIAEIIDKLIGAEEMALLKVN